MRLCSRCIAPMSVCNWITLYCVWFCLAVSPRISWVAECGFTHLSWSIQNVTSFKPSGGRSELIPATLFSVVYFGTGFRLLFEARPNIVPTFGIRMHQNVLVSGINLNSIAIYSTPHIPHNYFWKSPWVQQLILLLKLDFIVKFKCLFFNHISIIFTQGFTVCILFVFIECINIYTVHICWTFQSKIVFNMSYLFYFNYSWH